MDETIYVIFKVQFNFALEYILISTANWSPYIFTLVQKVKRRAYKVHVFLSEAILCQDSASYFFKNGVYFVHGRS